MFTHVIYKLTFPNGKVYIGQTKNFKVRLIGHKFSSKKVDTPLYKAIRKYGWENVKKEAIKYCVESRADFWERKFIKEFNSTDRKFGYNCDEGGNVSKIISKETRVRIIETRAMRNKFSGLHHNSKKIAQINKYTGKIIREWDSIAEASRELEICDVSISRACRRSHNYETAGGYLWLYSHEVSTELIKERRHLEKLKRKGGKPEREIMQLNLDGILIKKFSSIAEAMSKTGVQRTSISRVCRNLSSVAGGFRWSYVCE